MPLALAGGNLGLIKQMALAKMSVILAKAEFYLIDFNEWAKATFLLK